MIVFKVLSDSFAILLCDDSLLGGISTSLSSSTVAMPSWRHSFFHGHVSSEHYRVYIEVQGTRQNSLPLWNARIWLPMAFKKNSTHTHSTHIHCKPPAKLGMLFPYSPLD